MDTVERFAIEARLFAEWAEGGNDSGALAARNGLLRLTRLYLAALDLPHRTGPFAENVPSVRVDDADWKSVLAHAARLPLDYYWEVFNPLAVAPDKPVAASLADDIADIHRDVVTGLRHYHAGRRAEALFAWTFSLESHWGEHITGAIRALHCWLAANDPSGLAAEG